MPLNLSTEMTAELLRRRASGQSPKDIGDGLGISEVLVVNILDQIQEELLPNQKPSPRRHRLTVKDKSDGGKASQRSRQQQRVTHANRIAALIDTQIKSVELVAAFYWLQAGSSKEFLITLPNAEVGHLFYKALSVLGIPDGSIVLNWRGQSSLKEQEEIRRQWAASDFTIQFANKGSSKSMRLRVSLFQATDRDGTFKVSSRGLAQAFLKVGQQVVVNASGR